MFKKNFVFYVAILLGALLVFISCSNQDPTPDTTPARYTPPLIHPSSDSSSSESSKLNYPKIFCGFNGCVSSVIYLLEGNNPYIAYKNDHFNQ
jgi:hypothetical protein